MLGNRNLRELATATRSTNLTSIGIPANRVGLMVSFATTKGFGGRNGLEPVVGVVPGGEVAVARACSRSSAETGIASVWSWGWGRWSVGEQDPEKGHAACVWLWARSPSLCDAPTQLGPGFDTSLTGGPAEPAARRGAVPDRQAPALERRDRSSCSSLTGDRETAYSALFERLVESDQTPVPTQARARRGARR